MGKPGLDNETVRITAAELLAYCRKNQWSGYDPYDALNSRAFRALPLRNIKLARLAMIQVIKRLPINIRPLIAVPKTPNPKGIALILAALLKLSEAGVIPDDGTIAALTDRLLALRSPGQTEFCWGYNFDWQTRLVCVPQGFPNIICTTFAGNALLDAHDRSRDPRLLEAALSAARFIVEVLFRRDGDSVACFDYYSLERTKIHNANLFGAAFICRAGRIAEKREFIELALEAARYSVARQHSDGSWDYGEHPTQRWIDNFHTGYNLGALRLIGEYAKTSEFEDSVRKGFAFYRDHFFREDGAPRYFHDSTYPIDIHCVAQSIITLITFKDLDQGNGPLADAVLRWALSHLWDRRGFFYYQKRPLYTVRIPYMRWSEAWMLLALATYLEGR